MSEPLKVGDRVRVFADTPADEPIEKYLHYFDIGKQTGTVTRATKNGYIVRSDDGREAEFLGVCMELIERPRRTFEEIVKELEELQCIRVDYHLCEIWSSEEEPAVFLTACNEEEGFEHIVIHRIGNVELNTCLTTPQLEAITAASQEIADSYAAEHGKENK